LPSTAHKISGQLGWTTRTAESDRKWWTDCAASSDQRARHNPHLLAPEQVLGATAHLFTPISDEQLQPLRDRLLHPSTPVSHATGLSAQVSMKESNRGSKESNRGSKESNKEHKESNRGNKEGNEEHKENNMEMDEKQFVPVKSEVAYPDFEKLDLRVAQIKSAERVEGADKLLKLGIDLGFEQRVVVSGIAQHFDPEGLVGLKVVLLANLAPRKIRGQMSQGMILLAENADGRLVFAKPDEDAEPGAVIR